MDAAKLLTADLHRHTQPAPTIITDAALGIQILAVPKLLIDVVARASGTRTAEAVILSEVLCAHGRTIGTAGVADAAFHAFLNILQRDQGIRRPVVARGWLNGSRAIEHEIGAARMIEEMEEAHEASRRNVGPGTARDAVEVAAMPLQQRMQLCLWYACALGQGPQRR